jgi:nicotinamidase-related amidase
MAPLKLAALLHAGLFAVGSDAKAALLLIDVQDCFVNDPNLTANGQPGSLGVAASQIIPVINKIRAEKECLFDKVVKTVDYHPQNHISFASTHGLAPFAHTAAKGGLPVKCVTPHTGNTADASCCPTIHVKADEVDCSKQLCPPEGWDYSVNSSAFVTDNPACVQCRDNESSCFDDVQAMWPDHCLMDGDFGLVQSMTTRDTDLEVKKGMNTYVDAYSGFMDNSGNLMTSLDATLRAEGIKTLYIAGIATDVCVKWTVRDALKNSTAAYTVKVISDASAGLTESLHNTTLTEMAGWEGVTVITSKDILATECQAAISASTKITPWAAALLVISMLALRA